MFFSVEAQEKPYEIDSVYLRNYKEAGNIYNLESIWVRYQKNNRVRRADSLKYGGRIFVLGCDIFMKTNVPEIRWDQKKEVEESRFATYRFDVKPDGLIELSPDSPSTAGRWYRYEPYHARWESGAGGGPHRIVNGCFPAAEANDVRLSYGLNDLITKKVFLFSYSRKTYSYDPNKFCGLDSLEIKPGKYDDMHMLGSMLGKRVGFRRMKDSVERYLVNTALDSTGKIAYVNIFAQNRAVADRIDKAFRNIGAGYITPHYIITRKSGTIKTVPLKGR